MMLLYAMLWLLYPSFALFCGLVAFVSKRKHLLNALLSLEFIVVNLYFCLLIFLIHVGAHNSYILMLFLTLAACEGALGLALLVSAVRSHGSDQFSALSVLSC